MDIEQKAHAINNIIDGILENAPPTQKYNALLEKVIAGERILSELMLKMDKQEANAVAWEYFYKCPYTWNGNSAKLNIKTSPQFHEENGKTIVIHYTSKGELYCKSTDKDEHGNDVGEQPIFYYGRFEIDNHYFELSYERLKDGFIEFEPKKEASFLYTYEHYNEPQHYNDTKNLFYI